MRRITVPLPVVPGRFEASPETFFVRELPLYEASGEGDHLYLTIEKADWTTRQVVRRAAEVFGVDERGIGYAGLKDRHATSRQTISVLGVDVADAGRLAADGLKVLAAARHRNKLKVGHLAGNAFRVVLDTADPEAGAAAARDVLARLTEIGLPNYYGAQRFGRHGDNVDGGMRVLRKGPRAVKGRWKAKLLVSALQSQLFNEYLDARIDAGTFAVVEAGDVMLKLASGGRFVSDDPATDQARYDRGELSITGPMFGTKMRTPPEDSAPGRREAAILDAHGLAPGSFSRVSKIAEGTRRPLRALVSAAEATVRDGALELSFALPPGSYATVLIDEVLGAPSE